MTPALRITARRPGFRRAGMAHPARTVDHESGRFSAEQVAALKAEPMLVVEVIRGGDTNTEGLSIPAATGDGDGAPAAQASEQEAQREEAAESVEKAAASISRKAEGK